MKHKNYRTQRYPTLLCSALVGFLLTISITTSAAIYKWQDENGSWHFSETPPNDQVAEAIDIRVTPASGDVPAEEPIENAVAKEEATDEPLPLSPELAAAEKARLEHNCKVARENLFNLNHRSHIRFQDKEQGVERYLTEEEHRQWTEKSKQNIEQNCL